MHLLDLSVVPKNMLLFSQGQCDLDQLRALGQASTLSSLLEFLAGCSMLTLVKYCQEFCVVGTMCTASSAPQTCLLPFCAYCVASSLLLLSQSHDQAVCIPFSSAVTPRCEGSLPFRRWWSPGAGCSPKTSLPVAPQQVSSVQTPEVFGEPVESSSMMHSVGVSQA